MAHFLQKHQIVRIKLHACPGMRHVFVPAKTSCEGLANKTSYNI